MAVAALLAACNTFGSLDSVPQPTVDDGGADLGPDIGQPDSGPVDAAGDTGRLDSGEPDAAIPDADGGDLDGGPPDADMGRMPDYTACPATNVRLPPWAASTSGTYLATGVVRSDPNLTDRISAVSSEPMAEVERFLIGSRIEPPGTESVTRIDVVEPSSNYSIRLTAATVEPFLDIALANGPDGTFAFLALGDGPGCDQTGFEAIHGSLAETLSDEIGIADIALISANCDEFRPRAGLTGPVNKLEGNLPVILASTGALAFGYGGGDDAMARVETAVNPVNPHVATTRGDVVALAAPNTAGGWKLWLPATDTVLGSIDLGTTGDLQLAELQEGCHAATAPNGNEVTIASVKCGPDVCSAGPAASFVFDSPVRMSDVEPMPEGGFVVAVASGEAAQAIDLRFFGDDFEPLRVWDRRILDLPPGDTIGDMRVVTTASLEEYTVAVAYTRVAGTNRHIDLAVFRIPRI